MSWQELYRRSYPCDCGKCTVTVVGEFDDWNRSRESEFNSCKECVEKKQLLEQQKILSRHNRDSRINTLDTYIKSLIKHSYSDEWLLFASRFKTKKNVHKFISDNRIDHISESNYYKHNKGKSVYQCVDQLLSPKLYKKIISFIINSPNSKLTAYIVEIDSLYQIKIVEEINAMHQEYHGR